MRKYADLFPHLPLASSASTIDSDDEFELSDEESEALEDFKIGNFPKTLAEGKRLLSKDAIQWLHENRQSLIDDYELAEHAFFTSEYGKDEMQIFLIDEQEITQAICKKLELPYYSEFAKDTKQSSLDGEMDSLY